MSDGIRYLGENDIFCMCKCILIQILCFGDCFLFLDISLVAHIFGHLTASVACYSPAYGPAGFNEHIIRESQQTCTVSEIFCAPQYTSFTLKLQLQLHDIRNKKGLIIKLHRKVLYIVQQININLQQNYMVCFSAKYTKSWRFTIWFTFKLPCNI